MIKPKKKPNLYNVFTFTLVNTYFVHYRCEPGTSSVLNRDSLQTPLKSKFKKIVTIDLNWFFQFFFFLIKFFVVFNLMKKIQLLILST